MALDVSKVVVPGHGTVAFAEPNTAPIDPYAFDPAQTATHGTGWNVTYTSKENLPSWSKDGGDQTALDAWEQDAIATSTAPTTITFTANKIQIDSTNLGLAFPGGNYSSAAGTYDVASIGTVEKAVQVIMIDGSGRRMSIYMPRVSISLGDMPEINAEAFFELSVTGTVLTGTAGYQFRLYEPKPFSGQVSTAVPTITNATPTGATAGQTVTITGTNFYGTNSVKFGGTSASSYTIVSNTQITAVMPTGTAGSAPIIVTNNIGASASYAYTRG